MKFNKIVKSTFILPLLALSLVGCEPMSDGNKELSFADSLDYSTIGGIGLLNSSVFDGVTSINYGIKTSSYELISKGYENKELTQEMKESILLNLEIAKNTLDGEVVKSEIKESDKPEYEYFYTLTTTDILGDEKVYSFYYNSVVREEKDYDDGIVEIEREERLNGIIILDGIEYKMNGNKSTEDDEEEVTFKIMIDESNYVVIEQEMESNEKEFEYKTYKNGRKVYESSVSYEAKFNGKVELEFELEENGNQLEYKYEFFKENGISYVLVKIENNNTYNQILIQIKSDENGNESYEFIDNKTKNII